MSRHFELLNYSEHGTVVDNVVFCCDVSEDFIRTGLSGEASKEAKKPSYSGLDDIFRRSSADKTASVPFEPKEVMTYSSITLFKSKIIFTVKLVFIGGSLRMPDRDQLYRFHRRWWNQGRMGRDSFTDSWLPCQVWLHPIHPLHQQYQREASVHSSLIN